MKKEHEKFFKELIKLCEKYGAKIDMEESNIEFDNGEMYDILYQIDPMGITINETHQHFIDRH